MADMFSLQWRYKNRATKKVSPFLSDVISKQATIKQIFNDQSSPVEEIALLGYQTSTNFSDFKDICSLNRRGLLQPTKIIDGLYQTIYDRWDPSRTNIMYRSSGYDSRIISHLVRKVMKEKGGDVFIICIEPEIKMARPILEYEGWDPEQLFFYAYSNDIKATKFSTLYQRVGASADYPHSAIISAYKAAIDRGHVSSENTTLWLGVWFNELLQQDPIKFTAFIRERYHSRMTRVLTILQNTTEVIFPMLSRPCLETVFSNKTNTNARINMVKELDPKLASFPRRGHPRNATWKLSNRVYQKLITDYQASYYKQKLFPQAPVPKPLIQSKNNAINWRHLSVASMVEALVKSGVNVRKRKD